MFFKIVFNQALHKWGITLLVFLAMTALVALYVYLQNTTQFANRSMQLIMKNMGHNMLILPEDAEESDVYLCTEKQPLFSAQATGTLAKELRLPSKYYVSVLQERIVIEDRDFLLTGIEPVTRVDETKEKGNMMSPLKDGEARLGAAAARGMAMATGAQLTFRGRTFRIVETLPAKGAIDDYRIYINLAECQRMLGHPDRINAILAFQCLHGATLQDVVNLQERVMQKVLPGFRHTIRTDIAEARFLARRTTQKSLRYLLGIVLTVTVLVIAITGFQEVAERTREVGILVSMGANYAYIMGLYLAKILTLALAASLVGFWIGATLSVSFNASLLVANTAQVRIVWSHLPNIVGLTCLVALVSEVAPMLKLVTMDPNATLVEE